MLHRVHDLVRRAADPASRKCMPRTGAPSRGNVEFRAGDATELDLPRASADVVFSNWLLMYLSDAEVAKLAADALSWVRHTPG